MSGIFAELWTPDLGPPPDRCPACTRGDHARHQEFIWPTVDGVRYGPMTCDCLCGPSALEDAARGAL